MAYTPIEWDEVTPITPDNLNKMDNQIDTNEDDLRTIQGGTTNADGRITQNEDDIADHENRITTNEGDISNLQVLTVPIEEVENFSGTSSQSGSIGINDNMFVIGFRLYAYVSGGGDDTDSNFIRSTVSITINGKCGNTQHSTTAEASGFGSLSASSSYVSTDVHFAVSSIDINYSTSSGSNATIDSANAEVKVFYIDYS